MTRLVKRLLIAAGCHPHIKRADARNAAILRAAGCKPGRTYDATGPELVDITEIGRWPRGPARDR